MKTQPLQRVAFVIDKSGSMEHLAKKLPSLFASQWKAIKKANALYDMQTEVTLIEFDTIVNVIATNVDINDKMPVLDSRTRYMTALCSAVRKAVETIQSKYPEMTYLVIVLTDGQENGSTVDDRIWMADEITKLQGTDRWSFAFLVPDYSGKRDLLRFGVPEGNIKIWETTEKGIEHVRVETQSDVETYYRGRASGQSCTKSFFQPVTSNVATLDQTSLSQMDNVTGMYKEYEVEKGIDPNTGKEWKVSDFSRFKTGRPYIAGELYYMLIKKEIVGRTKQVVLRDKTTKVLYTGPAARNAIGLPKFKDAIVTPGNHQNYDIFVQSTSDNRILSRGTKVLVRK